jgi:hypothetical protein
VATTVSAQASNARLNLANDVANVQVQSGANIYGLAVTPTVANLTGVTTNILGTTATNINTTGNANNIVMGHAANVTNLNSATNNIGSNLGYATTNNMGVASTQNTTNNMGTGTARSTNNIGNTNASTSVMAKAGNAQMSLTNNSAVLTVPSGATGVNNGVLANPTEASLSGGDVSPTRLTMTDNAATFSRISDATPITVTGVANGRADFDAVNVRQFAGAIAAVTAQANVPALSAGQDRSFGIGLGNFMGKSALAMGVNIRGQNSAIYKLSMSSGLNTGGTKPVVGAGAAWGF